MKTIQTKEGVKIALIHHVGEYKGLIWDLDNGPVPLIIGRLNKITEDQAKELVEWTGEGYKSYHGRGFTGDPIKSLHSAAYSLGISHHMFPSYLVVKL